mmetsp:Transcript_25842/g.80523  ORF Transcript_25842/g.80523 Transcript_25842/m.80523 type:complete len:211 (+) Transcript_25842:604-1236(+)
MFSPSGRSRYSSGMRFSKFINRVSDSASRANKVASFVFALIASIVGARSSHIVVASSNESDMNLAALSPLAGFLKSMSFIAAAFSIFRFSPSKTLFTEATSAFSAFASGPASLRSRRRACLRPMASSRRAGVSRTQESRDFDESHRHATRHADPPAKRRALVCEGGSIRQRRPPRRRPATALGRAAPRRRRADVRPESARDHGALVCFAG